MNVKGKVRIYEGVKTTGSGGCAPEMFTFSDVEDVDIDEAGKIITVYQKEKRGVILKAENTLVIITGLPKSRGGI